MNVDWKKRGVLDDERSDSDDEMLHENDVDIKSGLGETYKV